MLKQDQKQKVNSMIERETIHATSLNKTAMSMVKHFIEWKEKTVVEKYLHFKM